MICHICKTTGERTCDPQEAEIKCMLCGKCAVEQTIKRIHGGIRDTEDRDD